MPTNLHHKLEGCGEAQQREIAGDMGDSADDTMSNFVVLRWGKRSKWATAIAHRRDILMSGRLPIDVDVFMRFEGPLFLLPVLSRWPRAYIKDIVLVPRFSFTSTARASKAQSSASEPVGAVLVARLISSMVYF